MESKIQHQSQPLNPIGAATARATFDGGPTAVAKVSDAPHAVREQVEERSAKIRDQTKQKAYEAYEQANKRVSEQDDYGHENPGLTTLIAVGVGIGLLLGSSLSTLRNRDMS